MILSSLLSDPVTTAASQTASSSSTSQDSTADAKFNGILSGLSSNPAGTQDHDQDQDQDQDETPGTGQTGPGTFGMASGPASPGTALSPSLGTTFGTALQTAFGTALGTGDAPLVAKGFALPASSTTPVSTPTALNAAAPALASPALASLASAPTVVNSDRKAPDTVTVPKPASSFLFMLQQAAGRTTAVSTSSSASGPATAQGASTGNIASSATGTGLPSVAPAADIPNVSLAADVEGNDGTPVQARVTLSGGLSSALSAMASSGASTTNASQTVPASKVPPAKQNQAPNAALPGQDQGTAPQVAAFLAGMLGASQTTPAITKAPSPPSSPSSARASIIPAGGTSQTAAGVDGTAQPIASAGAASGQTAGGQTDNGANPRNFPGQVLTPPPGVASNGAGSTPAAAGSTTSSSSQDAAPSVNDASMIKSVSVETQFAPVPSSSAMLQVIDTVQKLAASEGTSSAADPGAATLTSSAPSMRSMTLVLEPENMGTVTVTMQMRGNSLDLQLDVANPQTLSLLNKDRDSLTTAMSSQDYAIGSLTMRASDAQTASSGTHDGSQTQSQGNSGQGSYSSSGSGGSNGGASQGGGFSAGSGPGTGSNRSTAAPVDADSTSSGPTSGVYI